MRKLEELYNEIDQDEGLKSKKKFLTVISLILLAIQFTGGKIVEANTFILKLSFEHQNGMALLLMLGVIFSLIRYYNYAERYHHELYQIWSNNLLNDNRIQYFCPHSHEASGLLHESYPNGFDIDAFRYQESDGKLEFTTHYECGFLFSRSFRFSWNNEHDQFSESISIRKNLGLKKYFSVLKMEAKYQFTRYFTHRENLDILSPYFLGLFALASYVFSCQLNLFLAAFLGA